MKLWFSSFTSLSLVCPLYLSPDLCFLLIFLSIEVMSYHATNVNHLTVTNLYIPSILHSQTWVRQFWWRQWVGCCWWVMQFHFWFHLHHFNFYSFFPCYLRLRDSSATAPFYWDACPTLPPPASLPIFSSMVPSSFFFIKYQMLLELELWYQS
jgi:hypothetical protein